MVYRDTQNVLYRRTLAVCCLAGGSGAPLTQTCTVTLYKYKENFVILQAIGII